MINDDHYFFLSPVVSERADRPVVGVQIKEEEYK
jgi:hypothetical protein